MKYLYIALALTVLISGCITTESQADGSTKVSLSPPSLFKRDQDTEAGTTTAQTAPVPAKPTVPSINETKLAGLFTKHPYDGTTKTHFPRVAVTVHEWSGSCWVASAKLWWNRTKSESIPPFSVCAEGSLNFHVNNAAGLHHFIAQSEYSEHSGNVRTTGPKPPMMAIPQHMPNDSNDFIMKLVVATGWQPGAPTNMWIVDFKPK
ncbi:MAG: hypothetical protein FWH56_06060 [Betaproteobacteria bacterium]|nr:hypothetical protein [Betaproteobacteria bacterium]